MNSSGRTDAAATVDGNRHGCHCVLSCSPSDERAEMVEVVRISNPVSLGTRRPPVHPTSAHTHNCAISRTQMDVINSRLAAAVLR